MKFALIGKFDHLYKRASSGVIYSMVKIFRSVKLSDSWIPVKKTLFEK